MIWKSLRIKLDNPGTGYIPIYCVVVVVVVVVVYFCLLDQEDAAG